MSADRPADPALDDLLGRISAEAARRVTRAPSPARPAWPALASAAALTEPPPGAPAFRIRDDRRYDIADFLALPGDELLDACYRALLGRPPDRGGRDAFAARLAAGDRPVEVVGRLALSPEGRAYGARVAGLRPRFAAALAFRVPVAGYALEWLFAALALPVTLREQRARDHAAAVRLREARAEAETARRRLGAEVERLAAAPRRSAP